MTSRNILLPLLFVTALFAAACGSTSEAADGVGEGDTAAEETTSTAAETTTTAPETTSEPETTTAAPETTAAPAEGDGGDGSSAGVNGQEIYEARCASCHGVDGRGTRGPDLVGIAESLPDKQAAIDQTINGGNGMPAFGERLSPEEISAAIDYIYATF